MKSIEFKVLIFFNQWLFDKSEDDLNCVINTIDLDREDAIMIFEEFFYEFGIESGYSYFNIDKYFYKISFLDAILRNLSKINLEKKYGKKTPITVRHMVEVATRKEWFDPR